ncbi:phage virion morphogenesis protein [Pseudomonas aeruginosa]|uniref:phage virion morphogenesis protein n=1 Tax=Pseudomonas aeruginosa TaxID=287 RepID=UPI0005CD038E|nr:phage virion morphogenesis protein [Pseudomonas aeruginosa]KJC17442.1 tail protein [Pseudomonas aeruginosa]RTU53863.1 phage virion morphogenesis protein [Pseudomonas aeruginosa]
MTDNLRALEDWAGALLAKLEPGARRQLNQQIGRDLRRSQQQRIATQRNPDGSAFAPRKPRQLRAKKGRIKRQMFAKLRQAKHLKVQSSADAIAIGFMGRVARIARVHQYGLRDRPERGQADVQYDRRELLGFTDADLDLIRDRLLEHLTS